MSSILDELTREVWPRIDRGDRARLHVLGHDRAKFLHNLTTNEVKRLAVGRGVEAFVTSPQGKTLAWVTIHALEDRLLVGADPGGLDMALPHLRKYGMFDDVELEEVSARTFEHHIFGQFAEALFLEGWNEDELSVVSTALKGLPVVLIRESPMGVAGVTIVGDIADEPAVLAALLGPAIVPELAEALRIRAGTPRFGVDLGPDNLPQEAARDGRAISFTKGCYLGQETVARLDALGHVNKVLRRLRIDCGPIPSAGTPLEVDGKPAGAITSSAEIGGESWAIGMVRAKVAEAGRVLGFDTGRSATVESPHR